MSETVSISDVRLTGIAAAGLTKTVARKVVESVRGYYRDRKDVELESIRFLPSTHQPVGPDSFQLVANTTLQVAESPGPTLVETIVTVGKDGRATILKDVDVLDPA